MTFSLRKLAIAAALACLPSTALAADTANLRMIGFSPDGRYFGFEQFGVQDGSGFPYADIFLLDLQKDSFAGSTPIRVLIDDETARLSDARKQAHDKAASAIASLKINEDVGRTIAYNPQSEANSNGSQIEYFQLPHTSSMSGITRLTVTEFEMKDTGCPDYDPVMGFKLSRSGVEPASPEVVMHEDVKLPKSRGCPNSYRLVAVFAPGDEQINSGVAIVQVNTFGFEGSDGRYIAVPLPSLTP